MSSTGSMNDRKEITYFIELLEKELKSYCRQDFLKRYIIKFRLAINMHFVYQRKRRCGSMGKIWGFRYGCLFVF